MERAANAILQAAHAASLGEPSDGEVDPDGSSSLSEIQDQDAEQDEEVEASDDLSNLSDQDNDSEAETERLEESPNKSRPHQDVVLSSTNNQTYQTSPSKLHNEITVDDPEDDDDEGPLVKNGSIHESPNLLKSSPPSQLDKPLAPPAASLEGLASEGAQLPSISDIDTKKRKRSILADGVDEDPSEPLHKRTGSVMTPGDDIVLENDINQVEQEQISTTATGNNDTSSGGAPLVAVQSTAEVEETIAAEVVLPETPEVPTSPKRRGRKKRKPISNGIINHEEGPEVLLEAEVVLNGGNEVKNSEEEHADNEGDDEAEAALKNEEEREFSVYSCMCSLLTFKQLRENVLRWTS